MDAQELLKTHPFDLGEFGVNLIKGKQLQKKGYQAFVDTLGLFIPIVLIKLIIGYYDSFEVRKSLFDQVST